jgi:hypothetical protein
MLVCDNRRKQSTSFFFGCDDLQIYIALGGITREHPGGSSRRDIRGLVPSKFEKHYH